MKDLIPTSYKRAAIVEKLFKALALAIWAVTNIIIYKQFKN
jgi:hypothetical protein